MHITNVSSVSQYVTFVQLSDSIKTSNCIITMLMLIYEYSMSSRTSTYPLRPLMGTQSRQHSPDTHRHEHTPASPPSTDDRTTASPAPSQDPNP